jgi:hypothetical protein
VNWKRLIPGITIAIVLVILTLSGLALRQASQSRQARVEQRFPLQGLGYCTSNPVTPCVVSFGLDRDGKMLVTFLTAGAFYPDFYLTIKTGENEHVYVCQKVDTFATSVYCTGKALPVGEVLQFQIFSINEEVLLAQGNFPIIGMALAPPELFASATPTITPTGASTPERTPSPSYPSYPGTRP